MMKNYKSKLIFNNHVKYHNSQDEKRYMKLFETYFDPFIENKASSYLFILKKYSINNLRNKQVKFFAKAFVFTAPIIIGLYLLPGNQFKVQIEIKRFVRKSIVQFYKLLNDYSENNQYLCLLSISKEICQKKYIQALNEQYFYFEDQDISNEGQFKQIIQQYILNLNENPKLLEFALLHLDLLFTKILENHRYHYFIENSSILLDLLDMIKICLPRLEQKELELKYQFEVIKIQPITTLICCLFQYCQHQNERIEIYKYTIDILHQSQILGNQLTHQFHLLLPILYRDLALSEDELNLMAMNFLIELQSSLCKVISLNLESSNLLTNLLKDQLYSNIFQILNKKTTPFREQYKILLEMTLQNKEICYLMKETGAFMEEKKRLQKLRIEPEFESIVKQLIQ